MNNDIKAKKAGWTILEPNNTYEKALSKSSAVYIFKRNDRWCVWRGTWIKGEEKPITEKTIIQNVDFEIALRRANSYVKYMLYQKSKRVEE